jgi:hypothetical protein
VMLPTAQDQKVMIMGGGSPAINKAHIIDLTWESLRTLQLRRCTTRGSMSMLCCCPTVLC